MNNITITNLTKTYSAKGKTKTAISNISTIINDGTMFCIMGSSGSGKSTLLKILGGMDTPTSGEIQVAAKNISTFSPHDYDQYRQNEVGYVFQDFNLLEGLTLEENIILPLTLQHLSTDDISEKYKTITHLIDMSNCEKNYPEQSSGGEQQRAAICRALIKSPRLLLADEPTGSLDNQNAKNVLEVLTNINHTLHTTIVIVTHDAVVASYCDTVVFIENGEIYNTLYKSVSTQQFCHQIVAESSKARGIL